MTLEFRDHQILVISPGSRITQVQMGLKESLMPPAFEIPTKLFRAPDGKFSVTANTDYVEVKPIVKGAIADLRAFLYFLKKIYTSVQPLDGLPPALYLVASLQWTRRQLEQITQFCFEEIKLPALAINLQGTSTSYAFATSDCLIIDVGYEKTEIAVVTNFEENKIISKVVNVGGQTVNAELSKLLPELTAEQIEELKQSEIFEVLTKDQTKSQQQLQAGEEEDGVVDIAAILSSGRTREILDERERQKQGEVTDLPNAQKKENQFVDKNGTSIKVGKERFEGCDTLLNAIVDSLADLVYEVTLHEQQHLFDNVIICGRGSMIRGFRTELAVRMREKYVIDNKEQQQQPNVMLDEQEAQQGPQRLNVVRLPDHFPEWKNRKWEDYTFLGAQVGSKQVFTAGMEGIFVSRSDYNDAGPSSIWDAFN